MSCDLFFIAGEKSGDLHGERLMAPLLEIDPHLKMAGVGGPLMRSHPFTCVLEMEKLQVMGFIDVFLALPKLFFHFYKVIRSILSLQPKVVVTIDYPGFNLRLLKALRKRGFKGKWVHFICPSVWAWGKKRIPLMAEHLDLLLCVLPFETKLFEGTPLKTLFVGNPLLEKVRSHVDLPLELPQGKPIVSLFPGSRKKEVERNLPLMIKACESLGTGFTFAVSVSQPGLVPKVPFPFVYIPGNLSYELMKASYLSIAKSGTVTLELALHRVPTVVIYATSKLDEWIAYSLLKIRLPFYCLVNIIAGKEVFKEFMGASITPEQIREATLSLCDDKNRRIVQNECDLLIQTLEGHRSAKRAAEAILSFKNS